MPSLPYLTDTSTQLTGTYTTSLATLDNYATSNYINLLSTNNSNYTAATSNFLKSFIDTTSTNLSTNYMVRRKFYTSNLNLADPSTSKHQTNQITTQSFDPKFRSKSTNYNFKRRPFSTFSILKYNTSSNENKPLDQNAYDFFEDNEDEESIRYFNKYNKKIFIFIVVIFLFLSFNVSGII